jgi:hypothetical protein
MTAKLEDADMTDSSPRFLGLKTDVLYRIELGFAIIDDGDRLIRIQRAAFERVLDHARAGTPAPPPEEVSALVREHPTVFELFGDPEEARTSLSEKEI